MNSEEAKAYFEMRFKDKYKYSKGHTTQREAFEMEIKALEKQIPKKPTIVGHHYVCPQCGTWILYDDEIPNKTDAYCSYCGQAILWPENQTETSQDFNLDNIAKGLKKLRDTK